MLFSIIIPAYNAANFISDCIDSIISQKFPNDEYEVIVIDDCSTDNTTEIVESYKSVQLIKHEENKHQGGARNTGIKAAKGDWIFFVDSDDYYVFSNTFAMIKDVIERNPNVDIVRSTSYQYTNKDFLGYKKNLSDINIRLTTGRDILTSMDFDFVTVTSCYSKQFLIDNNLFFREHVFYEDSDWTIKTLYSSSLVCLIDFPFYGYRQHGQSTTNRIDIRVFTDNVESVFALAHTIDSLNMDKNCRLAGYEKIKVSILSFIRISRRYTVAQSMKCLEPLFNSSLMDLTHYTFNNKKEKVQFFLFKNSPSLFVSIIRFCFLIKHLLCKTK